MDIDSIRDYCLSLPNATEDVQWGNDLLFRIAGKIFAGVGLEAASYLSFKCTPEKFSELIERNGIIPAPYTARYHWVALERLDGIEETELRGLIRASYDMVLDKLPKKVKTQLE